MPIYMDRHDVGEMVTAEHVARLHQEDLKIQHQFGCRGLTYWFDDQRKTAFCLIEAPDKESLQEMHNRAHGQVPNRIIEVEPSNWPDSKWKKHLLNLKTYSSTDPAEMSSTSEPVTTIAIAGADHRSQTL